MKIVPDFHKNLKNSSADVLALRASVPISWFYACEQAPAQTTTSPHIAPQRKTSSEAKTPLRCAPLKKLRTARNGFSAQRARFLLFDVCNNDSYVISGVT